MTDDHDHSDWRIEQQALTDDQPTGQATLDGGIARDDGGDDDG